MTSTHLTFTPPTTETTEQGDYIVTLRPVPKSERVWWRVVRDGERIGYGPAIDRPGALDAIDAAIAAHGQALSETTEN